MIHCIHRERGHARVFLLVDLQEIFFRFRVWGRKKHSGNDQFFIFSELFLFLNSQEKDCKTSKVNPTECIISLNTSSFF